MIKTIETAKILENNLEFFNKEFEIIKNKIEKSNIELSNLNTKRTKLENLVDTFVGLIAEKITYDQMFKSVDRYNLKIINYDDIRRDNFVYPDLFDFILVDKEEELKIINKLEYFLNFNSVQDFFKKKKDYKNIENKNFLSIEVKSSSLKISNNKIINQFILYAKDKNPNNFKKNLIDLFSTKSVVKIEDYFKTIYPNLTNFKEQKEQYCKDIFVLSDILSSVLYDEYKKKIKFDDYNDEDFKDINFIKLRKLLPKNFYYNNYIASKLLIKENTFVGRTNKKLNAIYHINNMEQIRMNLGDILKLSGKFLNKENKNISLVKNRI